MKIKSILISQPEPANGRSPYQELEEKYNIKVDFYPFIKVEGVTAREFRRSKISILKHTAIVMTSRTAIEHFFRLCDDLRVEVPSEMKYFCVTEAIALYLQKFITYRKRKVFFPKSSDKSFESLLLKHKKESFLIPQSNVSKNEFAKTLRKYKVAFTEATMYRTVYNDLSELRDISYDILAFFSPSGIRSLIENFPDFEQGNTKIAGFGPKTCKEVKKAGLNLDIEAPSPQAPSMKMALEQFVKRYNNVK